MDIQKLRSVAAAMVARGKGILAIDESESTCKKRFEALGVECTEENRRLYRQLLVTAPGAEEFLSGMILFDETLRQKTDDGVPFPKVLKGRGIIPGIKVDKGTVALALHEGEMVTEGLDGLRERLAEYAGLGAEFAKWRAVIAIKGHRQGGIFDGALPSMACVKANMHALARYAALCQEAGLVPMVEPEILIDGDHSIERCCEVSALVWKVLFAELAEQGVMLEGAILKTSMVLSGVGAGSRAAHAQVAQKTVQCLKENVPVELAGVVFLSGGQSDEDATIHLNEMHKIGDLPWPLSFSYGRGIQRPALEIWAKNMADVAASQEALVFRAKMNSLAAKGEYSVEMENH